MRHFLWESEGFVVTLRLLALVASFASGVLIRLGPRQDHRSGKPALGSNNLTLTHILDIACLEVARAM